MELWHENDPGTEAEAMQDQAIWMMICLISLVIG